MVYKISLRNHLRVLDLLILTLVGVLVFGWYQANLNNLDDSLIDGLVVFALISFLPVLYLHIEHYYYSRGTELEINVYNKKFIYTDKTGTIETYSFDDLSKIIIYMPPHFHSKAMFIRIPFDTYNYAKIYTKSGKEIIFTCLLAQRVEDAVSVIKGVSIERKKRLFASILLK